VHLLARELLARERLVVHHLQPLVHLQSFSDAQISEIGEVRFNHINFSCSITIALLN
jgi:hypothetical protein